jgi:hypothetical protein
MEEFARGLRKLNLTHKPEVKVALIDDGVEVSKGEYSIATGKDFYEVGAWNAKHYFVAPGGHGTVMARLIGAICPAAKLYVARLHDVSGGRERAFTTKSAIKVGILEPVGNYTKLRLFLGCQVGDVHGCAHNLDELECPERGPRRDRRNR